MPNEQPYGAPVTAPRVVATVLTHNASASLDRVLDCLSKQSIPPAHTIVLDNASTEGSIGGITARYGAEFVRTDENVGVGAGHGAAWTYAFERCAADYVWALEHDSYPHPDCLGHLLEALTLLRKSSVAVGALAGHLERNEEEAARNASLGAKKPYLEITRFTFNGVLFPRETVAQIGTPREDFFVGMEDWEYSNRLAAAGLKAFEATQALLIHPTKGNLRFGVRPNVLRSYYSTRNWMRVSLTDEPTLLRTARCCGWCVLSIPRILLAEDQKLRRSAARVTATFDAIRGRMGRRNYWFLR